MKISYNWIQKYFNEKLPEPKKISEGIIFHAFEVEGIEQINNDTIFDIKILPDRAHDCLSHFGIAKEISVIFDLEISSSYSYLLNNLKKEEIEENKNFSNFKVEVKNDNCRRYMGKVIKNVKVRPSPLWLSEALICIGQKSINNIVDATNYVMFDLGNPIHAFDLDKLASQKIIIENAKDGESFTLLDGKEVVLDSSMLTIRDEKDILVVAGVKGGKKAEIDENTKNIFIEVANFEPISTRKTAKKLGIFTDSSKRFENDISVSLSPFAMDKVTKLILEIAGGEKFEVIDIYNKKEVDRTISFSGKYIPNLLGIDIPKESIEEILNRFKYEYKVDKENYEVKVSPLRLDLLGPHDIAEEIGRIYGYEKITPILPHINFKIKSNKIWENIKTSRNYLVNLGYREVINYTFTNSGEVEILSASLGKNFLRNNLSLGIKKSFELNKSNGPLIGNNEIKIFEIGTVFINEKEIINVCFINKKEIIEMSLEEFIIYINKNPDNKKENIKNIENIETQNKVFKPWSLYPFIVRDVAVWVPREVESDQVYKVIKDNVGDLLIKDPYLFDSFTKNEKTSYAYRLVFQSYEKTLMDEEINPIMEKINAKISLLGWEVR